MAVQAIRLDNMPRAETTRARSLPVCPICHDTFVAAEASVLCEGNFVQHLWSCETCGYGFVTEGKIVCH